MRTTYFNFFGLCNEAFPKQKIRIKRKSFNISWLPGGEVVTSSKEKQTFYEKFLNNRNREKEINYKQYIRHFESLKKKSKKNYYSDLMHSYRYIYKKNVFCYERNYWRQKSHQCPSFQ